MGFKIELNFKELFALCESGPTQSGRVRVTLWQRNKVKRHHVSPASET